MNTIFRGEEMSKCQFYFQPEAVYNCMADLGEIGIVQFNDLNDDKNIFKRRYINDVRRCEEMQRQLRYFEKEISEQGINIVPVQERPYAPDLQGLRQTESSLGQLEKELNQMNESHDKLKKNLVDGLLNRIVAKNWKEFIQTTDEFDNSQLMENANENEDVSLNCLFGVMNEDKILLFEQLIWRFTKGNVVMNHLKIEESVLKELGIAKKVLFLLMFQGGELLQKVTSVCNGFEAVALHELRDLKRDDYLLDELNVRIDDLKLVYSETKSHQSNLLKKAAKKMMNWKMIIHKAKSIYYSLNMLDDSLESGCLLGEGWVPTTCLPQLHETLKTASQTSGSTIVSSAVVLKDDQVRETPPTFFRTNDLTYAFQAMIESYGVGSYGEMNPMPYTIITFPFLFAVMFGDLGHATLMFSAALILCLKKFNMDGDTWNMLYSGRYIVLLMSMFSMYTGLLYNDVFAKPITLAPSSWRVVIDDAYIESHTSVTLNPWPVTKPLPITNETYPPPMFAGYPCATGIDPMWQLSMNKILYTNSLKMKISIILGVTHMVLGVFLSLMNHIYYKKYSEIILVFIPELFFLSALFVYLCILMFYKWLVFDGTNDHLHGAACSPSLLVHLINMFMFSYPTDPCSATPFFSFQKPLQQFLITGAFLCAPILLFGNPIYKYCQQQKRLKRKRKYLTQSSYVDESQPLLSNDAHDLPTNSYNLNSSHDNGMDMERHTDKEEDEFSLGEELIKQAIHTIEYCLGCISHTASYLRLWALSLAHSQLAEVVWTMVLRMGFSTFSNYLGSVALFIVFIFFCGLTVSILLLMEGLSAFLHALRLHWVEFQSKFYKGDGYKFQPFDCNKFQ
ncbi:hypothetical protein SNEBB_001889 [Seison nebaliae]|nr:hypothetical protein SNEBB_001889 [Seison nebaliae]